MAEKKYQIFVSSTYTDLKKERDVAIKAILEMGHIPVGMEMFSAADDEQWKIIERHIEESDYYCVVVAHRYGSTVGGKSFTHKEYEFAVECGVPVLGFLLEEGADWPADRVDKKAGDVKALKAFKEIVRSKPVSFWTNADDLYGRVSIALSKAFTMNPRAGWVRASHVPGPEIMAEITRLSAENSVLRKQAAEAERVRSTERSAEIRALLKELATYETSLSYKYTRSDSKWSEAKTNLLDIFDRVAPSMLIEVEVERAGELLAMELRDDTSLRWWTAAINQVRERFSDLMALGLIEPSKKRHGVSDKGEYWALTEKGAEVASHLRLVRLNPEPTGPENVDDKVAAGEESMIAD